MWWDEKIAQLTEETAQLTELRDEAHSTTGEVAGFDGWELWEIQERSDNALDEVSSRLGAWRESVPALRTASVEVEATSTRSQQAFREWGRYSIRSRRWARLALATWLIALVACLVWSQSVWLFAVLVAILAVSVAVGMWRVHRADALGGLANAAEMDYVDAMVDQELTVERLDTGVPVNSASEVAR